MANQKLLKKVAPVVLSAAMVMTSMPAAAMAADFSDSDVVADTVEAEETQESEADVEVDTEDPADVEDVDVTEDNASDAEEPAEETESDEEALFTSETSDEEFSDQVSAEQIGRAHV